MKSPESSAMRGFTLMEMLVVLLIASMALALTTQALSQYQRAYARTSASAQASREYRLSASWLRNSIQALIPSPTTGASANAVGGGLMPDAPLPVFDGDNHGFSGLTLAPVLAGQGVPVLQAWQVVRGPAGTDVLELQEEDRRILLSFPGTGRLQLHYLDDKGKVHDQWPPALGVWPQLPAAVVLEVASGADGFGAATLAAAVTGPRQPLQLPYEPDAL